MAAQSDWLNTNYYEVLGVAEDASGDEIRRAYRRLARELHPDTNADPAAERRFKAITAAHEVLGDRDRRREYDELRRLGPLGAHGSGGFGDLGDLFGDVFGSGSGFGTSSGFGPYGPSRAHSSHDARVRARRGADLSSTLSLPFIDAVHGTTAAIDLVSAGSTRSVKVRIPAGVEDGQTIRLPSRGEAGSNGGPAGDLYLTVEVEPHPDFGRLGNNLTVTVPVTFPELVLGTDVIVPTIDAGTVTVRVPAGTPAGRTMRVSGRGIPGTGGDLLVTLDVVVPKNPTRRERELIERLATATSERPRARWETPT